MRRAATWHDERRRNRRRPQWQIVARGGAIRLRDGGVLRLVTGKLALLAMLFAAAPALAAEPPRDGKALFEYHCGKCHDAGGTGTQMLTKRVGKEQALLENRKGLTAELVRNAVRHGVLSMPRITRVELPDAELDAIARYLTSSARKRRSSTSP